LKKYLIQTYFGCTPLWGRGRLWAFSSVKIEPINLPLGVGGSLGFFECQSESTKLGFFFNFKTQYSNCH
jgi:hypothetical protein